MKMHHNNRTGLLAALVLAMGVAAIPQIASAGISSTKHNMGTGGTSTTHLTTGSADLCVFCHTPHGAALGGAGPVPPLWNKVITAGTYTLYDTAVSSTIDGLVVGGTALTNSASLSCLSCHDGTQAMDSMINAPGSGGYNTAGAVPAGNVWVGNTVAVNNGKLMAATATYVDNLGTDLRNDHPIAIQYCGGGVAAAAGGTTKVGVAPTATACADQDFEGPSAGTNSNLLGALVGGTSVYWLEITGSVTAGGRDKGDLPLYTSVANGPLVECGSCHDPHTSTNVPFLRISNANSAMCLACHVK